MIFATGAHASAHGSAEKYLKYAIYYNLNEHPAIQVDLLFKGNAEGRTIIQLPSSSGNVKELYKYVKELKVRGATITPTEDPAKYIVLYPPNADVTLSYRIIQSWEGESTYDKFLAPILQKQYFQFKGEAVLIYPLEYKNENKILIDFDWHIPNGWIGCK